MTSPLPEKPQDEPLHVKVAFIMSDGRRVTEPSSDDPLHVQVARALGWTRITPDGTWEWTATKPRVPVDTPGWAGSHPQDDSHMRNALVPRYDTDWAATGPLIQRYRIGFSPDAPDSPGQILAYYEGAGSEWVEGKGPTHLIAACNLLLALHAAGKLEPLNG